MSELDAPARFVVDADVQLVRDAQDAIARARQTVEGTKGRGLSVEERLGRLERAVIQALNIDLHGFDPLVARAERGLRAMELGIVPPAVPASAIEPGPNEPSVEGNVPLDAGEGAGFPEGTPASPGSADFQKASLRDELGPQTTGDKTGTTDQSEPQSANATKAAAELAAQEQLDLTDVQGSGQDGRITVGDVEAFLQGQDR